ncbi:MAG TPA: carbon-nitrogen hydrolase family protein [Steroidobacteraceae bacterium]|nr:carbon-nitrogen hydrolase family protein [Steroidobacteraceae bacterium]
MSALRVAAAQMTSGPDVAANLAVAEELAEGAAAAGAGLLALPENFAFLGLADADKRQIAEADGEGPIQRWLAGTARRLGLWLIGGTIPLRRSDGERVAAACLVHDAQGRRVARYDKIHLFDVDLPERKETYRESANIAPGSATKIVETPFGVVGLSVCYDVRFPELYRQLCSAGAQLLSVPSAFTTATGRAHWEPLLRARAIENLCYVLAPAQSGFHPNARETYGDTMIIDYWGQVLTRRQRGRGIVVAEIDLASQAAARRSFPALQHRVL